METIKTAVVVTLLLAVLYGVYTVLNKAEHTPPPEVAAWSEDEIAPPLDIDLSTPDSYNMAGDGAPAMEGPGYPEGGGYESFDDPSSTAPGDSYNSPPGMPLAPADVGGSAAPDLAGPANPGPGEMAPLLPPIPAADDSSYNQAPEISQPPSAPGLVSLPAGPESSTPTPSPELSGYATPPPAMIAGPPGISPAPDIATAPPAGDYATPPMAANPDATGNGFPETGSAAGTAPPARPFERARQSALAQIEAGQLQDALFTLSLFYRDPDLSEEEQSQLVDLLDPLAGRVIYSREHLLTGRHLTQRGETLQSIADKYQVPAQLLANINGLPLSQILTSDTELKVVDGPFSAKVDLTRGELTLFLRRLYAGRFQIAVGSDPAPQAGEFEVKDKQPGQTYYTTGGSLAPNDPLNPYGKHWIDLGGPSLHGSPQSAGGPPSAGSISLSPQDAADIFGILSIGSKVEIRR